MATDPTETESTPDTPRPRRKSNGSTQSPIPISVDRLLDIRLECLRIVAYRASEREMRHPEEIAEKCFQWVLRGALEAEKTG